MTTVRRGPLIAVEGADGAGTTTQCQRLGAWLAGRGIACHLTREPSSLPVGRLIRSVLGGDPPGFHPAALALLFAADRLDHLQREIDPAREAGQVVVTDRYLLSSLVYQGIEVEPGFVLAVNRLAPPPDLTVLIDVAPEVAAARRALRGGPAELFEREDLQRRVIARYREEARRLAAAGAPLAVVDGAPGPDEVFTAVRAAVAVACGIPLEESP